MELIRLNTNNEGIKDFDLTHEHWFKKDAFLVQSFRICDNILISVSGHDNKSSILGREQLNYSKIDTEVINKISKFVE